MATSRGVPLYRVMGQKRTGKNLTLNLARSFLYSKTTRINFLSNVLKKRIETYAENLEDTHVHARAQGSGIYPDPVPYPSHVSHLISY